MKRRTNKSIKLVLILMMISLLAVPCIADDSADVVVTFEFYGPIWDINHDGIDNFLDISLMVSHYKENGTAHWIRDDMNGPYGEPDGVVNYLDVSMVVMHYSEEWVVP